MTVGLRRERQARGLAAAAIALALAGTAASAIDARVPFGVRDLSMAAAIVGLLGLAVVVTMAGEEALPEWLQRRGRAAAWFVPGLAVAVLVTMVVSRYAFRSCDDLADPHRCSCYYVAWKSAARNHVPATVEAQARAAVRAACPAGDIPPELKE